MARDDATADTGDGAGDAGVSDAPAGAAKGVIVVGGVAESAGGSQPILTVLAPEDGTELPKARTKMNVAAVQYDGLRELWYVFETSGVTAIPSPADVMTLHVRELDTFTGAWTEDQTLVVPTLVSPQLVAVLRERLVYVAYTGSDAAAPPELVTLDTSQPKAVTVSAPQPLDMLPFGAIGTRSDTGAGGTVNLLRKTTNCDGGASSCLEVVHVTVAPTGLTAIGAPLVVRSFFGTAGFGSYLTAGTDVLATADTAASTTLTLTQYYPTVPGTRSVPRSWSARTTHSSGRSRSPSACNKRSSLGPTRTSASSLSRWPPT